MKGKVLVNKFVIAGAVCLVICYCSGDVFARGSKVSSRNRANVIVRRDKQYHSYSRVYKPGWFNFGFVISTPSIRTVITTLPFGYTTMVIRGVPYYRYNNIYYKSHYSGYIVVPAPLIAANVVYAASTQSQILPEKTVIINVPNLNGSYTSVTLVKSGSGYIGPQGEYYAGNPTIEQLKVLYGK